jgi:hypothetical protein
VSDVKRIDIQEFRERGYLQEVNRRLLHPLGLALEIAVYTYETREGEPDVPPETKQVDAVIRARLGDDEVDGREALRGLAEAIVRELFPPGSMRLGGVWDYRDDPEGIYFAEQDGSPDQGLAEKARIVQDELDRREEARFHALGYVIQPSGDSKADDTEPPTSKRGWRISAEPIARAVMEYSGGHGEDEDAIDIAAQAMYERGRESWPEWPAWDDLPDDDPEEAPDGVA